jgi:hypothetical protein
VYAWTVGDDAGVEGKMVAEEGEPDWNVEAPHFGQKANPGLISDLQFGQSVFSERPQPLQNVSPSS